MRFLIDQCISPAVADGLRQRGHDAVHAESLGLARASDESLLKVAAETDRVVVTADTDFGDLLALRQASKPSLILFRDDAPAEAIGILAVLDANLPQVEESLQRGAIVVVRATRLRVRSLPLY